RLLQVDDVDPVAVGEDEPLHLGVPAPGLVPEVSAAVEQLLHGYNSHGRPCPLVVGCRSASGDAEPWHLRNTGPVVRRDRPAYPSALRLQAREVSPLARAAHGSLHGLSRCFVPQAGRGPHGRLIHCDCVVMALTIAVASSVTW